MSDGLHNPAFDQRSAEQLSVDVEAAGEVKALADMPGWARVVDRVEEKRQQTLHLLIHGGASESAARYADLAGEVKGLEAFSEVVGDIVREGETAQATIEYREAQA